MNAETHVAKVDRKLSSRTLESPVGELTVIASERGLVAVLWPVEREGRVRVQGSPTESSPLAAGSRDPSADVVDAAVRELSEYFSGGRREFDVPTDADGTAFQRTVWQALGGIGWGETTTYGALAATIGRPSAVRAVAAAVGRNPLSVVWGCHRIVGSNGALTGFAGGLAAKRWLLDHEGSPQAPLFGDT